MIEPSVTTDGLVELDGSFYTPKEAARLGLQLINAAGGANQLIKAGSHAPEVSQEATAWHG